ncbi:DUF1330 domain-containing protein [Nocardia sp. 2]|uniref:DUF1330 domain-containing protein n=1 Tax=Nocardia acididurans TaxID=2802282 RepID=A0ABS1MGL7_9NOCA|nr:DUF1330 domain-containing protein [Nocardia acididurans]MBL1079812.1 DUF1330 domain-containing protein [Nocardia acididurans]
MTAYAIAHLHSIDFGPELAEYLRRVDATLEMYGGRFLVHGGRQAVREGPHDGLVVVVEFPDLTAARQWYDSPEYQAIVGLRTSRARCTMILAEKCSPGHRAIELLGGSDAG